MSKHKRNSSAGGGSLKDEIGAGFPLSRVRKKHSESDILDAALTSSQESQQWIPYDETDALPSSLRFNIFDICCILFSIISFCLDLATDCYVAYVYYTGEYIGYFVLTLVFVIVPSGTMTAFSLRWYVMDLDNQSLSRASCGRWIIRTIFLLLQLAPVLRYVDSLIYGLKSRKAEKEDNKEKQLKYYTQMVNEDADATLLRLFEGFMESAPQVTLQLHIFIRHLDDPNGPFTLRSPELQVLAILTSFVSLAWSLASYHRSLRYAQPDKLNISYKGTFLQFTWHFCSLSARIFALAVFSTSYPVLILPVCVAHWLVMLTWLLVQGNQICSNQCEESLFMLVVAFIYVFTFFNIRDEPTRYKYLTFYCISFLENTVLLFIWFLTPPNFSILSDAFQIESSSFWLRVAGIGGDYIMFFLGIISMILYYSYCHPSLSRKKSLDIEKDTFSVQPFENTKVRSEFLSRRGSLDQGPGISHSMAGSNPSSRRNVTFAMDYLNSSEKGRRNSLGDSLSAGGSNKLKLLTQGKRKTATSTPMIDITTPERKHQPIRSGDTGIPKKSNQETNKL